MLMLLASFRYVNPSIMFVRNNEFVVSFVDLRPINSIFFLQLNNVYILSTISRLHCRFRPMIDRWYISLTASVPKSIWNAWKYFWICINLNSVDFDTSNKESQFFSLCHMIDGDNRLLMQRRFHGGIKYILVCWRGK